MHRIELEYGLTDHWDLALYHVFTQEPGASFRFDSWRLETRYRLFEKNVLPVDVELYFEVERPADFAEPFETEEKLILEKDFGRFALVANLVAEQKLFHAGEGHLWEIDAGARYEVVPQLRLGAELWTEPPERPASSNFRFASAFETASVRLRGATIKTWILPERKLQS